MKSINKFWAVIVITFVPAILLAQSGKYIINGKVAPLPATAKAYLWYTSSGVKYRDSTTVINGGFSFTGTVEVPVRAFMIINKLGTGVKGKVLRGSTFYLEPGTITLNSPDSLTDAKVTGGPINMDDAKLKIALKPVSEIKSVLNREYEAASPEKRKSKEFSEAIAKKSKAIEEEQKELIIAFIKANPNSLISLFSLKNIGGVLPEYNVVYPLFNALSPAVKSSKPGVEYAANLKNIKAITIGSLAPDFTMADTAGKDISLHDFKGKYVLIDFWASWCGPCRAENPNVVKNYDQYKNKGFKVLGVSLDRAGAQDKWLKAIHDDHLTWTQVADFKAWQNAAAQLYAVELIPQNFLVGPDGRIVAKNLRGNDLNNELAKLFGKM